LNYGNKNDKCRKIFNRRPQPPSQNQKEHFQTDKNSKEYNRRET